VCYGYTHNKETAEDLVQDIFMKYLKRTKPFSDEQHEKYWLIRVAVNLCKNYVLSAYHTRVSLNEEIIEAYPSKATRKETEVLKLIVKHLPKKYKEVIILYYYNTCTTTEIARILHISLTAVKKRLERARKMIQEEMEDYV
ncbi:MAG: sigma-70 family RNA polymerase sigma factor, partial [Anaeroplasmataceae bacterium]|nr:sigma-70 family RNA polymerase sigma factor [Anaeroplasmataceae bacterium]